MWRPGKLIGTVTEWKPITKGPRGGHRQRLKDRVDKDLEEIEIENGVELAKEINRWIQGAVLALWT